MKAAFPWSAVFNLYLHGELGDLIAAGLPERTIGICTAGNAGYSTNPPQTA